MVMGTEEMDNLFRKTMNLLKVETEEQRKERKRLGEEELKRIAEAYARRISEENTKINAKIANMKNLLCPMKNGPCIAESCVHFYAGTVTKQDYDGCLPYINHIPPRCKLWAE